MGLLNHSIFFGLILSLLGWAWFDVALKSFVLAFILIRYDSMTTGFLDYKNRLDITIARSNHVLKLKWLFLKNLKVPIYIYMSNIYLALLFLYIR